MWHRRRFVATREHALFNLYCMHTISLRTAGIQKTIKDGRKRSKASYLRLHRPSGNQDQANFQVADVHQPGTIMYITSNLIPYTDLSWADAALVGCTSGSKRVGREPVLPVHRQRDPSGPFW